MQSWRRLKSYFRCPNLLVTGGEGSLMWSRRARRGVKGNVRIWVFRGSRRKTGGTKMFKEGGQGYVRRTPHILDVVKTAQVFLNESKLNQILI